MLGNLLILPFELKQAVLEENTVPTSSLGLQKFA